ncbi:hypothetical protein H6P87_01167 [Rickettsia tillamookensis]|uniref:Uncharacterized protein n=1 Tax=Rickettsia tillamookensis TaxID=2761623 RepID=A0A9E6MJ32_9RICK|nr:hypothetical protein [Rickettsia tillamookensis]QQV75604.1 hypothetical protein H6P87_01167 [Rickettsia tillamookensis]
MSGTILSDMPANRAVIVLRLNSYNLIVNEISVASIIEFNKDIIMLRWFQSSYDKLMKAIKAKNEAGKSVIE